MKLTRSGRINALDPRTGRPYSSHYQEREAIESAVNLAKQLGRSVIINYDLEVLVEVDGWGEPEPPPSIIAADYFVATDGDDANDGSTDAPFATIGKAAEVVQPGDVVLIRGGMYRERIVCRVSGTPEAPITFAGYPGEEVIVDGYPGSYEPDETGRDMRHGWEVDASWNVIRDLTVRNSNFMNVYLRGERNVVRRVLSHGSRYHGFLAYGKDHLFEDCVARDNQQPDGGYRSDRDEYQQSADGFALKAPGTIARRCIAYRNADDGFDSWGSGGVRHEACVAFDNGFDHGNGNGFKASNEPDSGNVYERCIAFRNLRRGFTNNGGSGHLFDRSTAFRNGGVGFQNYGTPANEYRNNIAFGHGSDDFEVWSGDDPTQAHNTWNLGITAPEFKSVERANPDFLALAGGSPCIGAGLGGVDLGALDAGQAIADLLARPLPDVAAPEPPDEPAVIVVRPHEWVASDGWTIHDGYVTAARTNADAVVTDSVTVDVPAGAYSLVAVVQAPGEDADAFYVGVDGGGPARRYPTVLNEWAKVAAGVYDLDGEHAIDVGAAEAGLHLAALALVPEGYEGDVLAEVGGLPEVEAPEPPAVDPPDLGGEYSLRGDPNFDPAQLDDSVTDSLGATIRGYHRELIEVASGGEIDDKFDRIETRPANRQGALHIPGGLLMGLRVTGDLRLLDESVRLVELVRAHMTRDENGFLHSPGTEDPHSLDTRLQAGLFAHVMEACRANADLASPAGYTYGAIARAYHTYLTDHYLPRWRGLEGTEGPDGLEHAGSTLRHAYAAELAVLTYCRAMGGGGGFTTEQWDRQLAWSWDLFFQVVSSCGSGHEGREVTVFQHNCEIERDPPQGVDANWVLGYSSYTRYIAAHLIPLWLDGADGRLDDFVPGFARAFADLSIDAQSFSDFHLAPSIGGTTPNGEAVCGIPGGGGDRIDAGGVRWNLGGWPLLESFDERERIIRFGDALRGERGADGEFAGFAGARIYTMSRR